MELTNIISEMAENAEHNIPLNEGDYIGSDGLIRCGKCNTRKQCFVNKRFVPSGVVFCMCECEAAAENARREADKQAKAAQYALELRRAGITDPTYQTFTFKKDSGKAPKAVTAAKWYADNFPQMREQSKGIMFMGGVGTGKTFAACCIANAVIDKGYKAWVTTMRPLLRAAGDFNSAESTFNRVRAVDLLVLDDFGTVGSNERELSLLFEMIDARYRSGLPLIITTNLTPNDLKRSSLKYDRLFDRIKVMCMCEKSPVVLTGGSIRGDLAREKHEKQTETDTFKREFPETDIGAQIRRDGLCESECGAVSHYAPKVCFDRGAKTDGKDGESE